MLEDNWGHVGMDFPCVVGLLKSRVLLCSLSVSLSLTHTSETAFEFSTLFLCSLALGLIIFDDMEPLNLSFL